MLVFNPLQAEQLVLEFFPQKITELNNALKASHCILENLVPSTVQQGSPPTATCISSCKQEQYKKTTIRVHTVLVPKDGLKKGFPSAISSLVYNTGTVIFPTCYTWSERYAVQKDLRMRPRMMHQVIPPLISTGWAVQHSGSFHCPLDVQVPPGSTSPILQWACPSQRGGRTGGLSVTQAEAMLAVLVQLWAIVEQ